MTTKRSIYTSATLWFVSYRSFLTFWSMNIYYFTKAIGNVILLPISAVCNIRNFRIVRQHQLQIDAQQRRLKAENHQNLQQQSKCYVNKRRKASVFTVLAETKKRILNVFQNLLIWKLFNYHNLSLADLFRWKAHVTLVTP